jgi:hypothetical protein
VSGVVGEERAARAANEEMSPTIRLVGDIDK